MKFVIITGLSGAGKSLTIKCMEDLGFFCVDNLPPVLIPRFAEVCEKTRGKIDKIALVMDIRGGLFFDDLFDSLKEFQKLGYAYEILFLDAGEEVLIKRFKETRRTHPLSGRGTIAEGIRLEREKLKEVQEMASTVLDTSRLNPTQLKKELQHLYVEDGVKPYFLLTFLSFGFKHGIPLDADMVFDARFLPNPFYEESMKNLSGLHPKVQDYALNNQAANEFLEKIEDLLLFLIPQHINESRNQLVVAIGCTGGRHRSVSMVQHLAVSMEKSGFRVVTEHRDLE